MRQRDNMDQAGRKENHVMPLYRRLAGYAAFAVPLIGWEWGHAALARAQLLAPPLDTSQIALRWMLVVMGFVGIVFVFYKPVYGYLLRYYSPSYCKQLVWSMMFLYLFGWLSVAVFVFFGYGFDLPWSKWGFTVADLLWFIWLMAVILFSDV